MKGSNHSIVGFTTALNFVVATWSTSTMLGLKVYPLLLLVFASAAAYKADMDMKANKGQRKGFGALFYVIDNTPVLKRIFGHRGLTHVYLIPIAMIWAASAMVKESGNGVVTTVFASLLIGGAIGYASHVFIDFFNGKGCPHPVLMFTNINIMSVTSDTYQETIWIAGFVVLQIANAICLATGKGLL